MKKTILIILLFSSLAQSQFWENPNQKPSLFGMRINRGHHLGDPVGFWLMSDRFASKVFDLSGNGYDGTLQADAHFGSGKFGSAIVLDGTGDYIQYGDITQLDSAAAFTFIIWFNQTALDQARYFFSKTKDDDEQIIIETWIDGELYIQVENVSPNDGYGHFDYSAVVTAGKWYQLAVVFDGSGANNAARLKCYIDAQLQTLAFTNNIPTVTAAGMGTVRIGDESAGGNSWLGSLDVPSIYSRPLPISEIALLYREPFCMFEPNWDMELYGWMTAPALGAGQFIFINMN